MGDDNTKRNALILGLLALLGLAVGLLTSYFTNENIPEPVPSVTGSSPLPSPTQPSPSPSPSAGLVFKGVVGETVGREWVSTMSGDIPEGVKAYEILTVETRIPSFRGAVVGLHEDPLKPVTTLEVGKKYWIEAKLSMSGCNVVLCTQVKAGPMRTMPFYSEIQHNLVGTAHGLADTGTFQSARFTKTIAYRDMLRAHGVEPIKHWYVALPPVGSNGRLALDQVPFAGAVSYRQMVLTGAIAPPMIVGPNISTPSSAFIAALTASVAAGDLPPESFIYYWDEQEGIADNAAFLRLGELVGTRLVPWATRNITDQFRNAGSHFCPVVMRVAEHPEWISTDRVWCAYQSCMSQGNCQNKTDLAQVAPPTGDVMMVIDAPAAHARAYASVLHKLGVSRGLYYAATVKLPTAWQANGLYNEGGQGDGTLLYPGTDGNPWPSLRLKRLHRGLQDVYYWQHGGVNPVRGARAFPLTEGDYEVARISAWEAMPE